MQIGIRPSSRTVSLWLLLAVIPPLSACYKWSTVPDPAPAIAAASPRATFRLVTVRGDTAWLRGPRLLGDSVVGEAVRLGRGAISAVALRDVVEVRRQATDLTGTIIGVGVLGVIGMVGGAAASFGGE